METTHAFVRIQVQTQSGLHEKQRLKNRHLLQLTR